MNRIPYETPPMWWSPKLSPWWVNFWRPLRRHKQRKEQRLQAIEVRGLEHLQEALNQGHGVLITPNHSGHSDSYVLYEAADQVRRPFYFMATWQVFGTSSWLRKMVLRQHGCFSVDREGTDLRAFRQAVEILQSRPNPLVIFPEGEVYHINERVTPFREGPATIVHTAARKGKRPIVCVPCGITYYYVEDPTPELNQLMDELERELFWRPRPDLTLDKRIYRIAEGALALKELEYLGQTCAGPLPDRIANLMESILSRMEDRYGSNAKQASVPERVKALQQEAIKRQTSPANADPGRRGYGDDLDDLFFVIQLFSYPGDYVSERPTIERMAETLDKFEEDIFSRPYATVRGTKRAIITFGEPIPVDTKGHRKDVTPALSKLIEQRVQHLLNQTSATTRNRAVGRPLS